MTTNGKETIASVLLSATKQLMENESIQTPRLDCELLLSFLLECERIDLLMNRDAVVSKNVYEAFFALVKRRAENEPISYLTGEKEFMSLPFSVCPGILIPRPETELLVEQIIEQVRSISHPTVLDLCTGSGAIAVSVAHYVKQAKVMAVDKYDVCVSVAQKNAIKHGVSNRVDVKQADVFDDVSAYPAFHCIVSNPPYVQKSVLSSLPKDVADFEPTYALDGGDDGLTFYRRIAEIAKDKLLPQGFLALEIGFDQGKDVSDILKASNAFYDVQVLKDYAGLDRMVTAIKSC